MSTTNAWMLGSAGVIGACGVAGALYQACAARRDAARYPAPGRMVDVGGHRLHLQVLGEARSGATVVLEAGLDSFSTNWHWVQSTLASSLRVVAYDRAGLGWSDNGSPPRDAHHSAADLHTALRRAGISSPYVLGRPLLWWPGGSRLCRSLPGRGGRACPGGRIASRSMAAHPHVDARCGARVCQPCAGGAGWMWPAAGGGRAHAAGRYRVT